MKITPQLVVLVFAFGLLGALAVFLVWLAISERKNRQKLVDHIKQRGGRTFHIGR